MLQTDVSKPVAHTTSVLSKEQIESFHRDGFIIIRNALTPDQVKFLRNFFRPKFDTPAERRFKGDTKDVLTNIFDRYPEIDWLLFHKPMVDALKSILGENYAVMPENVVHHNRFGPWHKDTTTMEMNGWNFFKEKGFLIVGSVYYLQDNTPEFAGGLDVEPGSHKTWDPFIGIKNKPLWQRRFFKKSTETSYFIQDSERLVKNPVSIANKAGDLVISNFRISHRASQPQNLDIPFEHEKIGVFGTFGRNDKNCETYINYLRSRPDPDGIYASLDEPSYPDHLLNKLKS